MNYRLIVFSNRLVPESVRWLMTHGKIAQAEKILKRVAKINRKEMPDDTLGLPRDQKGAQQEAGFTDLFRTRSMTKKTIISWISWLEMVSFLRYFSTLVIGLCTMT